MHLANLQKPYKEDFDTDLRFREWVMLVRDRPASVADDSHEAEE